MYVGHVSIETWVDACSAIKSGQKTPKDFLGILPTLHDTLLVTCILEAGRKSLDAGGVPIDL
jgi:D-galacturonate reductase